MSETTFEGRLADLERIVRDLEEGELTLDESLRTFERGVVLVRGLRAELDDARLRVRLLQDDGTLRDAPDLVPR